MDAFEKMKSVGIVPVVVLDNADDAVPAAAALLAGGIDVMEITFRTPAAADAIAKVAEQCPDMFVGAGTVTSVSQAEKAVRLGAGFIITPGIDEDIITWCLEHNVPICPGIATPTEIMKALKYGLKVLKFFPAGVYGGVKALKALSGPFPDVKFIPTGGVSEGNMAEYFAEPSVLAVGGSFICTRQDIAAHDFTRITGLAASARAKIRS